MARGTDEKQLVLQRILETFENSFIYNKGKEIRIPVGDVQIKVTLTCAKDNVSPEDENAVPNAAAASVSKPEPKAETVTAAPPSEDELDNIANLLGALGL